MHAVHLTGEFFKQILFEYYGVHISIQGFLTARLIFQLTEILLLLSAYIYYYQ